MNNAALATHDDLLGPDAGLATSSPEPNRRNDEGRPVREIEAVCARHNLHCGSPADLPAFLRALGENKLLAMNFWSAINRMGDGKHGPALDPAGVRDAVVRGVTGQTVEQVSGSSEPQRDCIDRLTRLLAGEDVQLKDAPAGAAVAPPEAIAPPAPRAERTDAARPAEPVAVYSRLVTPPPAAAAEELRDAVLPRSTPASTDGSRMRLVLDSEPAAPTASRLRLQPERADGAFRETAIPLSSYAARDDDERPGRRIATVTVSVIVAACVGALAFAGVSAWRHPDNTARQGISSFGQQSAVAFQRLDASIQAGLSSAHAAWSGNKSGEKMTSGPAPASATTAANNSTATVHPQAQPSLAAQPIAAAPGTPAPLSAQPVAAATRHRSVESASDYADAPTPSTGALDRDQTLTSVPAGLMKDHLISSRFPIVPNAENANAISGYVTVAAVITDRGTVEHAYAINGPDQLRQPAIEAVSQWRYRPYLLNSAPISVRTTIVVNFAGD